jgi:hypothetical protein
MAFGLVFLDPGGAVWTVDVETADERNRRLLFSRPSFLEPAEQRTLNEIPPCWPNCSDEELQDLLDVAVVRN